MATPDVTTKKCPKCNQAHPLTEEFWYRRSDAPNATWRTPCKKCIRARDKVARDLDPDKQRDRHRRYAATHKDQLNANQRRWRRDNPEKAAAQDRRYREANPERRRDTAQRSYYKNWQENRTRIDEWARRNPEQKRRLRRESQQRNAEAMRARSDRRRARKRNATGSYTKNDIIRQYQSQKGRCWWCSTAVGSKYHVDHLIPLSRGGSNEPRNLVISCETCNRSKSNKLPHEWNGRLL